MKKAVVVGAAGFVGNAVVKKLLSVGVEVYSVVRPGFSNKNNHCFDELNTRVIECDITKISSLKNIIPTNVIDTYFHLAWDGLRGDALLDYTVQINNIKWTMDAIKVSAYLGCKKFIGAGSISQYELATIEGQIAKNDKHKVYKTAKLACEYMGRSVSSDYDVEFYWPIITNIYGEGETSPRLINTMIRNLLSGKHQSLSEGNQIYDFIHISDAAKAFYLIGAKGKPNRKYVIGSGEAKPLKHYMSSLGQVVSPQAKLGFGELTFNGIYLSKELFDISNLHIDTNFKPEVSFEDGIRETANWIAKNIN